MKKVVVIGAGPAGLTAAYKLLCDSAEYEVIILEESSAAGGISRTVNHNGNRMDIGGHRFFTKSPEISAMWEKLMPKQGAPAFDDIKLSRQVSLTPGGPDPESDDRVMLTRRRISRIYYRKRFFDYPVKMNYSTVRNMGFAVTIKAGLSYLKTLFHKYPEISLEKFYINRFGKKLYTMFFESYTEKLWGRHPRDISADWGAQRVKGVSLVAVVKDFFIKKIYGTKVHKVETSLIEEFSYPKFGPGHYWELVASQVEQMGGRIIYNCKVEKLVQENGTIVHLICSGKNSETLEYDADTVISSMPLKDLVSGLNDVPDEIRTIASGLPYRDFVTIGVLVKNLKLKNETKLKTLNNIVPDCWIYVQEPGVKLGRIQIFNNWSPYMVEDPENTVWLGLEYFCSENDEYWNKTDDEWVKLGHNELISMGVIDDGGKICDSHVVKVKKAYPAYFDTYCDIDKLTGYLDTINNLYCVGRNGQHRYNNMDHSMATSFAAVKNILSGSTRDKSAVWKVNTEKEYHEEKQEKSV